MLIRGTISSTVFIIIGVTPGRDRFTLPKVGVAETWIAVARRIIDFLMSLFELREVRLEMSVPRVKEGEISIRIHVQVSCEATIAMIENSTVSSSTHRRRVSAPVQTDKLTEMQRNVPIQLATARFHGDC